MRYDPPSAAKASPFGDAARSADYTHHVIVILIVSFIARLVAVRFLDLTFMETYGAVVARNPSISFFDQPPLTWWTIAGVMRLFGSDDALIVRLPFLVMSVVSGWLIYLITLRIFNSRAGLYAVCAYSLSPLLGLSDGSLAQTNGPMTLFILAALLAFLHIDFGARRLQDNGIWFACAFLFGCALASKYLAVLLVPGLLVAVASQAEGRRWLLRPATYFGLVFLLLPLLPVIIWNAEHGWVSFLYQGARAEGNGSVNLTRAFRWTLTQVMIVHPLVFFPAFYMLYRSLGKGPREAGPWLLACLAAPVLLFILGVMVWSSHPLRGYHWASMGYLPLLPLVGAWADGLAASDRPDAARRWLATLATTTIVAICLLLSHAFTGWAERVAPAKAFRNQDPILLELYDWSDLPSALTARGVDPARTFIAATRWEDCAKAFYAIRQQFRSLCLAGDNIHFTYLADPARFRGMDAIIVDRYANPDAIRYNLDGHFETFSEDSPIRLTFNGRKMHDLKIVRASRFDGTWPKPRIGAKGRQ
ncbi:MULTISPECIES: glycosyltransferase family 39 protein [unclassified Methylobacterium]|uniref:ArnT family glycosyltransferase n=1 Tax=unclassified Methylobacterium TaxID=2615210 RepID=UPI0006FF1E36|nr:MULTISPECIES: glycosyltransferase family 39 protein [unclassified Methylobacterium]KQO50400.1 hypothetical protein ASF24_23250 [Methylobacterium sp. Leaf86]KQO91783.1 hypothetical protein ASF32_22180 [Methylobacterium sp. Leaf91]